MPRSGVLARRRRRRVVGAVCVPAVVVAGVALLVAASHPSAPGFGGTAAAFVPVDGAVSGVALDAGVDQREERVAPGVSALFSFPQSAQNLASAAYDNGYDAMPHWVTYHSAAAGRPGGLPRDLSILTPDGIRVVAAVGYPTDSVYVPGMLVLPADAAPGSTWHSEGTAVLAQPAAGGAPGEGFVGQFSYLADYTAREPSEPSLSEWADEGCLETVSHVGFTPKLGGAAPLAIGQTSLWCPGRGIVATSTSAAGSTVVDGPADPALPSVDLDPEPRRWADPSRWRAHETAVGWVDPLWGDTPYQAAPALPPVVVAGRLALADVNSGDVLLLASDGDTAQIVGMLHPGGDVTTMIALGEALVVATSDREVVAYAPNGIRLWTDGTPDLIGALAASDDGLVLAGIDGSIALRDGRTGREIWRTAASAEALDRIIVDRGTVVAADRVGGVFAVDLEDGRELWSLAGDAETVALAAAQGLVYLAQDTRVHAVSAQTGQTAWVAPTSSGIDDLLAVPEALTVVGWRDTIVLDPGTGAVIRTGSAVDHAVTDGVHTLLAAGDTVRLEWQGAPETWEVPREPLGSGRYLVAGPDEVWLVDSVTGVTRLGP